MNPEDFYKANEPELLRLTKAVLNTHRDINDDDLAKVLAWCMTARMRVAMVELLLMGKVSMGIENGEVVMCAVHPDPSRN